MLLYLILIVGAVGVILLLLKLASGPSASKALKRRMELVKERHAEGVTAAAQAQIRKLMAARSSRFEGFASTIIPRPGSSIILTAAASTLPARMARPSPRAGSPSP